MVVLTYQVLFFMIRDGREMFRVIRVGLDS